MVLYAFVGWAIRPCTYSERGEFDAQEPVEYRVFANPGKASMEDLYAARSLVSLACRRMFRHEIHGPCASTSTTAAAIAMCSY